MKKIVLWFCFIFVTFAQVAFADNISVTGTVLDDTDDPVIGAAVVLKGSKNQGVQTDMDGKFRFASIPSNSVLVISYVGMKTVEVKAKNNMTVRMEPAHEQLETVIVTAFGTAKKSAFTGSAAVLSADKIEQKQVSNVMSSLMGEVPGLDITPTTAPGETSSIIIRGEGSINASTDPLIVVDGTPYDGGWNDINPQDVESITVLKDAASSALYGARGANGVILITTKKGDIGRSIVNFNAKWGANSRANRDYDRIDNPGEYYEVYYRALYNNYLYNGASAGEAHVKANGVLTGSPSSGGLGYNVYSVPENEFLIGMNGKLNPNATLGNRVSVNGNIYTLYPDNWTDEAYRTGFRQEYNFSVSGAGEKYSIYTSIGYLDESGIVASSDYERYSGRLRATYNPMEWFQIGSSASYTHSSNNYSYGLIDNSGSATGGGVFTDVANIAPIYPLYIRDQYGNIIQDINGDVYDWGNSIYNNNDRPSSINDNSIQSLEVNLYNDVTNNTNADIYADVSLPYGFKATVKAGVTVNDMKLKSASSPYYGYFTSTGGSLQVSTYMTTTFNFQQLLNWNRTFGQSNIQAMIGHESYNYKYEYLYASKDGAVDYKHLTELNGYLSYPLSPYSLLSKYNTEGYMARVMYDYKDRYFTQASFRRDASSRFHPDHRWGNFWSVGGAWVISREDFFDAKFVNNLKVKASYGEVGNDRIKEYAYVDTYDVNSLNGEAALTFKAKGNKDITWETISNLNGGVEFDLFDYRLSGTVEYYYKKSSDMLLWFSTPTSLGYSGYYKNIGDMVNQGIDVTLSGTPVRTKKFNWGLSLNFNYNNQRVTYLPEGNKTLNKDGHGGYQLSNYYYIGEGLPLYTLYIAEYAGPNSEGRSQWYKDADENGNREVTTDYNLAGRELIDPKQKLKGGFSTNVMVCGIDVTAQFVFGLGGKGLDREYAQLMSSPVSTAGYALHKDIYNAWTPENPNSDVPRFCYGDQYSSVVSTRFLTSLTYLSFQNFQVGYTFPTKWSKKLMLSKIRIYAAGDNLYLWSKRKGFDPRISAGYGSYSPMRTISGGLNIQF